MALTTTAGSGNVTSQANTQSPQVSAGSGSPASAPGKSVQPGTATSLLSGDTNGQGITLTSTILPVANLNTSSQTVSSPSQPATKNQQHSLNLILLAVVIVFFVLAIVLFWQTARSAKNTTNR